MELNQGRRDSQSDHTVETMSLSKEKTDLVNKVGIFANL